MAGETDFGTPRESARIGNPLLYVRRVLICVIGSMFSSEYLTNYPGAPPNRWRLRCDPDGGISSDSDITISDRFVEESSGTRPQIVIGRGVASWGDQAIGDQGQYSSASYGWTAVTNRTDSLHIPIEISVYAKRPIEAEEIGFAVSLSLKQNEPEIRSNTLIHQVQSTAIGPAVPYKSSSTFEGFKLDLQTSMQVMLNWQKRSTLSNEQLQNNLCEIDGMGNYINVGDLCVFAKPENPPEHWT